MFLFLPRSTSTWPDNDTSQSFKYRKYQIWACILVHPYLQKYLENVTNYSRQYYNMTSFSKVQCHYVNIILFMENSWMWKHVTVNMNSQGRTLRPLFTENLMLLKLPHCKKGYFD